VAQAVRSLVAFDSIVCVDTIERVEPPPV